MVFLLGAVSVQRDVWEETRATAVLLVTMR